MEHRPIISLVTWNSAHYLEALFTSLKQQTEQNCELLITDNASTDDTLLRIAEHISTLPFPVTVFREKENTGFSRAHNHHIREAIRRKAQYILVLNPDCILEAHTCETLLRCMKENDVLGSVGGKILRARFTGGAQPTVEKVPVIDSTGIFMTRARQWKERGYGEEDRGQYAEGAVFGVSGACGLYRLRALMGIAFKEKGKREFFDEDFFSYKEDVDCAWRLQLFGWSAWYTPHAIAWHHRTFGSERRESIPVRLRALSWRNNLLVFLKNDDLRNFLWDAPLTFGRECVKFFWILFNEPSTLQLFPSLILLCFRILQKRRWIMQNRRRDSLAMRQIFRSFR